MFTCGCPMVMMGLDLTRQALYYPSIVERMSKNKNSAGKLFTDLMNFFCMTQKKTFGWEDGPSHGRTNCDFFNLLTDKPRNTKVCVKLDVEKFLNIVEECIKLYD